MADPPPDPGRRFGDLLVLRAGVRAGTTPARPRGWPGAACECKCGRVVAVPVYRLLNGNTKSCGCEACFRPRKGGIRARIEAYVTACADAAPGGRGGAWYTAIKEKLGLTDGQAGGHLHSLLRTGRLERPARGWYCPPGRAAPPP